MMTSSELEGSVDWKAKLAGLIVGHVESVEPHPNADRLRIATVHTGKEKRTIVCDAPNLAVGQHVIVALPGVTLHPAGKEPFTLGESVIRGVTSYGMLCALDEIGIPAAAEGIFVLDEPVKPGTAVAEALFEHDIVLDLEITPNRPDLLSHLGLAREVATFEHRRLIEPPLATLESKRSHPITPETKVQSHRDCPRYSILAFEGVTVTPSPWWLQSRLIRCGIRPINIVVDITNYVMLELGQPLHAFDADKLAGTQPRFSVRLAKKGESIALLDGTTRTLLEDDLIVTNGADQPIGLAGIMGGTEWSITETTTRVFIEAACFSGSRIRKTSRHLGLRTDASLRFEKGLDPELVPKAQRRVAHLLEKYAGAQVASRLVEDTGTHPVRRPRIKLSFDQIHRVLGVRISAADCKNILTGLGFALYAFTKSGFETVPPSWRHDVMLAEDVIEELIRIWGYEHLPLTLPTGAVKAPVQHAGIARKQTIRHALASNGYQETLHIPFCSAAALERCHFSVTEAAAPVNPLSAELAYLSPSHLIGMLQDCGTVNREQAELSLFEIGKIFSAPHQEQETLTLLKRTATSHEHAIRSMKAALEQLARLAQLPAFSYASTEAAAPYAATGASIGIFSGETPVGTLSVIDSSIGAAHKIRQGRFLVAAEISLEILLVQPSYTPRYTAPPTYPTSTRSLTVTTAKQTAAATLIEAVGQAITQNPGFVQAWQLSDVYSGASHTQDEQSVTFTVVYGAPDRTLTDEEIATEHARFEAVLKPFVIS
jgi:phenylalanyl-tRNA synthetase beta chain